MINTIVIMGRLTFEPELKVTPGGAEVLNFQVACDRGYQKQGEERKADFIDCVAWNQTAQFISKYFHKGSMIALNGSLTVENYTNKNGEKRKSVAVTVRDVSFCGSKNDEINPALNNKQMNYSSNNNSDFEEIIDDDFPW